MMVIFGGAMITISCKSRKIGTKGAVGRFRRDGLIPYVAYCKGETKELGVVSKAEIEKLIRSIRPGFLATTRILLKNESGQEREVIVKEIQYHPTSYSILHLDFLELEKSTPVTVRVPIEYENVVDCVGVKLGGMLRSVSRNVRVKCLPKDIPNHFQVDVKNLELRQSLRIKSIDMPKDVRCLANPNDVVVSVVKK
jgi:large subunit ribosomal protein L25